MACGEEGIGRLADVDAIVSAVVREAERRVTLEGVHVLITGGGTREAIDPVRFLGNRASGKTGVALAREASMRGASVTLVTGPTSEIPPPGVEVVCMESAQEMHDAVLERISSADVFIGAAAVADYRPAEASPSKLKKGQDVSDTLTLEFVRTPDIVAEVASAPGDRVVVGFAAETEDLVANARDKLQAKKADLIVANDVSRPGLGFDSDENQVVLVTAESEEETPVASKDEIASIVLDRIADLLGRR